MINVISAYRSLLENPKYSGTEYEPVKYVNEDFFDYLQKSGLDWYAEDPDTLSEWLCEGCYCAPSTNAPSTNGMHRIFKTVNNDYALQLSIRNSFFWAKLPPITKDIQFHAVVATGDLGYILAKYECRTGRSPISLHPELKKAMEQFHDYCLGMRCSTPSP